MEKCFTRWPAVCARRLPLTSGLSGRAGARALCLHDPRGSPSRTPRLPRCGLRRKGTLWRVSRLFIRGGKAVGRWISSEGRQVRQLMRHDALLAQPRSASAQNGAVHRTRQRAQLRDGGGHQSSRNSRIRSGLRLFSVAACELQALAGFLLQRLHQGIGRRPRGGRVLAGDQ